ncbi:MAG: hypothetical protein Q7J16_01575 [Candidatus Cloacimonadales bacterium]|nr:hypothetical protein [Candidatus Cloacimonadales bacterium]
MKKILTILILLIIVLAVLLTIWNKNRNKQQGIIIQQNETKTIFSLNEIRKLEKHAFTTNRGDNYSGYLLSDILKSEQITEFKYLILQANDGGSLRLNTQDIPNAYLILMDEVKEPALRLVISTDEFGQRWMKYVKTIEVH